MTTRKSEDTKENRSPFHKGEHEIQQRLGVRHQMERFGRKVIRDYMPKQHQDFYQQLPFIFVAHADKKGWPWASIVLNPPGFIRATTDKTLNVQAVPIPGDPLQHALTENTPVGLLGIELTTRRRNRLSGRIQSIDSTGFTINIEQAFGNCPQYIQTRKYEYINQYTRPPSTTTKIDILDDNAIALIQRSDTFFVASYSDDENHGQSPDISHRGGRPGFVRVDNPQTLTVPDYLGNFHFNTLGNFLQVPKAGLLFLDFENAHVLMLTGSVEILWNTNDMHYFKGAERLWRFRLNHGYWLHNALPLRWTFNDFSANTLLTGTWREAYKTRDAELNRQQWMPYDIVDVKEESRVIKSFYLKPQNDQLARFEAGQFLTVRANIDGQTQIRSYTVSSDPSEDYYRISVKREPLQSGQSHPSFSNYLHNHISLGDKLDAQAPRGTFTLDTTSERPAVLISAGIGITPMLSIAHHVLKEGIRTRSVRPLILINAARSQYDRGFFDELNELSKNSAGYIRNYWVLSQIDDHLIPGTDYHQAGRISKTLLQAILPLDDYDFYLCGPASFMQNMYDTLRELSVNDNRIHAESFGPAALKRNIKDSENASQPLAVADEAIVEFKESNIEQAWSGADDSLLEFAEAHGLTPPYGCRNGQCGTCKVKLVSGEVTYQNQTSYPIAADETLLCCAAPAKINDVQTPRIVIEL